MKKRWFALLVLMFIGLYPIKAQYLDWKLGLMGFADNREYKSSVQIPQSIFGTQFIPEINLRLDSIHTLGAGLNVLHEFGSNKFVDRIDIQLNYQFAGELFNFTFGSFSKNEIFKNAPKALYYDSLLYFRPNIKGLLWSVKYRGLKQSVYLDWTSRKDDTTRETFIMGGFGEYSTRNFYIRNHIYMYHYAGAGIPMPGDHVRDNGVAYIGLGVNAGNWFPIDSMSISLGVMQSYERTRKVEDWRTPVGLLVEASAEHKGFGISNTLYIGEGHRLDWGDPFYRLKRYNRLDVYATIMRFSSVRAKFGISLHFAESSVSNQQQFFLRVQFDSRKMQKPNH